MSLWALIPAVYLANTCFLPGKVELWSDLAVHLLKQALLRLTAGAPANLPQVDAPHTLCPHLENGSQVISQTC